MQGCRLDAQTGAVETLHKQAPGSITPKTPTFLSTLRCLPQSARQHTAQCPLWSLLYHRRWRARPPQLACLSTLVSDNVIFYLSSSLLVVSRAHTRLGTRYDFSMSSPEEDGRDGDSPNIHQEGQELKKRRIQRACDICRRKKSQSPSPSLLAAPSSALAPVGKCAYAKLYCSSSM